jgi:hypothetical protein
MTLGSTGAHPSSPPPAARLRISVLALCTLLSLNALAFNSDLQPEQIEEAYSLGQTSNHEELGDFLKQYQHEFPYPADNPVAYVESVEFQTPYEQVVLRSKRGGAQYSKLQADDDYRANTGLVIVRVMVALKIHYAGPVPPADNFNVTVSQLKPIEPRKVTNTVLCDPYSQITYQYYVNRDCSVYTRELLLQFDANQFAPGRATIKVSLPRDQSLETKYNLDKLK